MEKLSKEYFLEQSKKNYKDLIGKSLKIVHTGSRTYPDKDNPLHVAIDPSYVYYLFDIESFTTEAWKYIEYLKGIGVEINFWSEKEDECFDMSGTNEIVLDFQNEGEFEKDDYYLIDKEEGLAEVDYYYKHHILRGLMG